MVEMVVRIMYGSLRHCVPWIYSAKSAAPSDGAGTANLEVALPSPLVAIDAGDAGHGLGPTGSRHGESGRPMKLKAWSPATALLASIDTRSMRSPWAC